MRAGHPRRTRMKLTIPAVALLGVGLILVCILDWGGDSSPPEPSPPDYSRAEMRAIASRAEALEQERLAVRRFREELRRAKDAVLAGSLSLAEAADRVAEAARHDNPGFLSRLQSARPDLSERARVIHCLLTHIQ